MTITIPTTDKLQQAAAQFAEATADADIIAFHAPMGAGKTTFIRALCQHLGTTDNVTSPSFAIVNEYTLRQQPDTSASSQTAQTTRCHTKAFHFDFYRLRTIEEAQAIGIDDYLYSKQLCLIEWPDIVEPLLPSDTLHVSIATQPDGTRLISF